MPLQYVTRYAPPTGYLDGGTQYIVGGSLTLPTSPNTMNIVLKNDIYSATGDYILFDYSSAGSWTGSLAQIVFDSTELLLSEVGSVFDDPTISKIVLRLQSKSTNGTQHVEGTLDVSAGPMSVVMSSALHKTAGIYVLFRFPNGYSVNGPLTNIVVTPPSGRGLLVAPYQDGNDIKVQLS